MKITEEMRMRAGARILAKDFKSRIPDNMALKIPDDIADALTDEQVPVFFEYCRKFGLVRREDFYWEYK